MADLIAADYLGDSVYARFNYERNVITLYTDNGYGPTNVIHLETEVYHALLRWVELIKKLNSEKD